MMLPTELNFETKSNLNLGSVKIKKKKPLRVLLFYSIQRQRMNSYRSKTLALSSATSRRFFHTTKHTLINDIREKTANSLPKVTGKGPFAETAKFSAIDNGSLLHLTIPASAQVHTRRGTILGVIDGKLADVESKLSTNQSVAKLARAATSPILYQQITSISPVSLLIGTQNNQSSYVVLPLSKEYDWVVAQRKALLGWVGASVEPYSSLKFWGNINVKQEQEQSNGQLVLAGDGKIFQLEVDSGETIWVNPSNVIAYTHTNEDSKRAIVRLPRALTSKRLELPQLPGWIERYFATLSVPPTVQRVLSSLKTVTGKLFFRDDDVALRVEGPRTVLVQSKGTPLSHVFDKREIKEIASHK